MIRMVDDGYVVECDVCGGEMCRFCKETEIGKSMPCEMGCETMRRAKAALEKAGGDA